MPTERSHPHPGDGGVSASSSGGYRGGIKPGEWSVSTRSIGEVLTTEIRCDELRLLLFAKPVDETARRIEARMEDLLASHREGDELFSSAGAIPAPLQHAVDVLLELVDDLEHATQRRAGAVALYQSSREVACACIGGGEPDVWSGGHPFEAPWVVLREAREDGDDPPHARGFAVFARPDLDMHLQWPYLLGTPRPAGVLVDARWQSPQGFEVTVRQLPRDDRAQRGAGEPRDARSDATSEQSRGEFFAGWFDDISSEPRPRAAAPPEPLLERATEDEFQHATVDELEQATEDELEHVAEGELEHVTENEFEVDSDYERDMEAEPEPESEQSEWDEKAPWDDEQYDDPEPEQELHPRPIPAPETAPIEFEPPYAAPQRTAPPRAATPHAASPQRPTPRAATPRAATPLSGPIAFPDLIEELRVHAERVTDESTSETLPYESEDAAISRDFGLMPDALPAGDTFEPGLIEPGPIESDLIEPGLIESGLIEPEGETRSRTSGRTVRRPEWPVLTSRRRAMFDWRAHAWWAGLIVVLFALGWWLGTRGLTRPAAPTGRAPLPIRLLRAVGLASPRFTAQVRTMPSGASIAIDGKPTRYRTPAEIELPPGERRIAVTLRDLGTVTTQVKGKSGATVPIEIPLTGSLQVSAPNPATPVAIVLDGESRGYAPLKVNGIAPGTHEFKFTAAGQPPWTQTVTVPVRGDVRIVARPFVLPATGVIHIGATYTDDEGNVDLKGASVIVDGTRRGATPLTLELPRGPHSLRAEYRGEDVPVQVIDLPGGNERFAVFSFGTGAMVPRLVFQSPRGPISRDVATPVSVAIQGLTARDVREMWLHVQAPDGTWRRYPMTVLAGEAGPVGVVVFPSALIEPGGDAPYYVSLLVSTGEEYFTDITQSNPRPAPPPSPGKTSPRVKPSPMRNPAETHADPP